MKKVLITGGTGQLGAELSVGLKNNYDVINTSKQNSTNNFTNNNFVKLDISKREDVKRILTKYNPNIIINCGALTNVDECEKNKNYARQINVQGLANLISYSKPNTKIVQISTNYVFDGKEGAYSELDSTYPINYYGKTKLESENILRGSNREYLIIRTNVVYSANFKKYNNFVSWVYKNLKNKSEINVCTDQISNPTWTKTLIIAINQLLIFGAVGLYNFGSGDYLSRYDFAKQIAKIFKFDNSLINPILTSEIKFIAERPLNCGLTTDKITSETNVNVYDTEYILNTIYKQYYQ